MILSTVIKLSGVVTIFVMVIVILCIKNTVTIHQILDFVACRVNFKTLVIGSAYRSLGEVKINK